MTDGQTVGDESPAVHLTGGRSGAKQQLPPTPNDTCNQLDSPTPTCFMGISLGSTARISAVGASNRGFTCAVHRVAA